MRIGLTLFKFYFALASFFGFLNASSLILGSEDKLTGVLSVSVMLIISGIYLYFAFRLKSLLLKRREVVQAVLLFVLIRNLLSIFFGANISTAFFNTDLLGKFLTIMIFGVTIAFYIGLIYGIQILSRKVIQAKAPTKI